MPLSREVIRFTMKALIDRMGCLDAAGATINARYGEGGSKSALSKKCAGHSSFAIDEMMALEDAMGSYPMTTLLWERVPGRNTDPVECLATQSGKIAKEAGEAVEAILRAHGSNDIEDRAKAIAEAEEVIAAIRSAIDTLNQSGSGSQ